MKGVLAHGNFDRVSVVADSNPGSHLAGDGCNSTRTYRQDHGSSMAHGALDPQLLRRHRCRPLVRHVLDRLGFATLDVVQRWQRLPACEPPRDAKGVRSLIREVHHTGLEISRRRTFGEQREALPI